jgi:transcription-repair coupling factor (superfamily II helicase)
LKTDVHVLTLTATPIPRTLQMAMSGLRELSVIQTPPVDRLAVRTYVMPWDGVVIREALLREHYRGGQSFFVVPRISDIADIEEFMRAAGAGGEGRRRAWSDGRGRGRGAHVLLLRGQI